MFTSRAWSKHFFWVQKKRFSLISKWTWNSVAINVNSIVWTWKPHVWWCDKNAGNEWNLVMRTCSSIQAIGTFSSFKRDKNVIKTTNKIDVLLNMNKWLRDEHQANTLLSAHLIKYKSHFDLNLKCFMEFNCIAVENEIRSESFVIWL